MARKSLTDKLKDNVKRVERKLNTGDKKVLKNVSIKN